MRARARIVVALVAVVVGVADAIVAQSSVGLPTDDALLAAHRWRNIGPSNPRGRIAAIRALDADFRTVLLGSASGGVFLSRNAGITWKPIFDRYGAGSIGAVAFFQKNPDVIWVGTGEAANRNSSGWGDGVYRSTDGGATFTHVGLAETHHIAEIATHPDDPDVAWAAAVGHLWGYSGERGLFHTRDGGATWTKVGGGLPDDGKTGCTEITLHPDHPDVLFCGMYHRLRQPWSMDSGGGSGGLFRSVDGGQTWTKLTAGLPTGATGMIDVDIHRADPRIVVANVEASEELPADLSVPGPGVYRSDDGGDTWRYLLRHNTRPFYHGQVAIDPVDPARVYAVSRDFRVSDDGGKTWRGKTWGGGGDDHDMWIAPTDGSVFYLATDQGALLSLDRGRTVLAYDNLAIGQYYAIGVDMREPYWVVGGLQDCGLWIGPSNSREPRGILDAHATWVGEGDGFHSQVDPTDWRTLYLVNHVGFAARLNLETREHAYVTPTPETVVNFADWVDHAFDETATVYTISPGEHWFFGERPDRAPLPPQFRFNWSSPLVLSPHDPHTVYFAGNHVFRSRDRGATWRIVSPDLTTNDPARRNGSGQGGLTTEVTGGENHCTIVTVAESPLDPAVVWAGTDDGNVQVTRDDGATWTNVRAALLRTDGAPRDGAWVSRVEPSRARAGRCYVALDDHRRDDMRPYVFVTEDFGASWRAIGADLPADGSVYVVREDPVDPSLLFVGTEFGAFCSTDRGARWRRAGFGLPTVAVHDLVVHPRDGDLVAGTHGRSVWVLDDIAALRHLAPTTDLRLCEPRPATKWRSIRLGRKQPNFLFRGENPPRGALIHFVSASERPVEVVVDDPLGAGRWVRRVEARAGMNRVVWPFTFPVTDTQRRERRESLRGLVDALRAETPPARHAELDALADRLESDRAERSTRTLNGIRRDLARAFAAYAVGRPRFASPLVDAVAPAGRYRVAVRGVDAGDRDEVSTVLTVRDDPLLSRR